VPAADAALLHEGLDWAYCGPRPPRLGPPELPPRPAKDVPIEITADDLGYDRNAEVLTLTGRVELAQGARRVHGDEITYGVETEEVTATGRAYLAEPGVRLVGSRAQVNLGTEQGRMDDVQYRFTGPLNARGSASEVDILSPELSRYRNITYTACPPGRNDWSLKAERLSIDRKEGEGVARHATLRVADVPVFYMPYLSFPIDGRRKSGFLIPTVGSSDESGFELTTPYYFNIAPNLDATIYPRVMGKRGLMLGAETRFLTPHHYGELYGEAIPSDALYEDNGARGAFRALYRGNYGRGWFSYVKFNAVSDNRYLEDFGNSLEVTSSRNIERRGSLYYSGQGWQASATVQDFQTVDPGLAPADRPYGRLPRVLVTVDPHRFAPGLELGMDAEYDFFSHDARVHGSRAAANPYASWPIRRPYGHLIPRLNLFSAAYGLQDQDPGKADDPSYAIPSFNLDGKLIFERNTDWFGHGALQTLEPRIFYLYTPFKDQDDIPTFDSTELTFSYSSLFRPNRFTGRDRIGDANQLTVGLTSRTLSTSSGWELLRASLGQIFYFANRRVQIRGPVEDESSSALAGELAARLTESWSGRASFQWDPNKSQDQSEKRVLELHYQTEDDHLVNLAYRFDLGSSEATRYEDSDVAVRWPLASNFEVVGRWYYSLLHSETMEAFAGMEYGKCCWRLRVLGRHFKNSPGSSGTNSIMVQFELAGLGSLGHNIDSFLERGIYGYHAE
jgi:LPS-assembly protein